MSNIRILKYLLPSRFATTFVAVVAVEVDVAVVVEVEVGVVVVVVVGLGVVVVVVGLGVVVVVVVVVGSMKEKYITKFKSLITRMRTHYQCS